MARSRSPAPAAKRRHYSRGNKIAQPAILRFAAGPRLRDGRCGAQRSPSRPRWSRAQKQQQEITMAQIGTFTRAEDGSYTGAVKTLSLNIKARFLPAELSGNEKAPN